MCSGPKSAWKRLYSRSSSTVKYKGGCTLGPDGTVIGRCGVLEDTFLGEAAGIAGYGNGVCSLGGCVYEAR